jgi:hypothetical protein
MKSAALISLVFRALAIAKRAFVSTLSERIHALPNRRVNLQVDDSAFGFRVEATDKRIQKVIQATGSANATTLARKAVRAES